MSLYIAQSPLRRLYHAARPANLTWINAAEAGSLFRLRQALLGEEL
jgi:hypothetical protein